MTRTRANGPLTSFCRSAAAHFVNDLAVNRNGAIRTVTLMRRTDSRPRFYELAEGLREGQATGQYVLSRWRSTRSVELNADTSELPEEFAAAVTESLVLPADGSLFGWSLEGTVAGLIAIYTRPSRGMRTPSWSPMPLAGSSPDWWPQFVNRHYFGQWFWDAQRAGEIEQLHQLIAANAGAVFWLDRKRAPYAYVGVEREITQANGITIPEGVFAYRGTLKSKRHTIPPAAEVIRDQRSIDLATRF